MQKIPAYALAIGVAALIFYAWVPNVIFHPLQETIAKEIMQIIISAALLAASLFVILWKGYGPKDKHWAYGTIGTLLGFWLHP